MKILAGAVLLILAGCMDDYSPAPTSDTRTLPDAAAVCPGGDCWGMHHYGRPIKCVSCSVDGLPTGHFYCKECASKLERCAHCGRKSPAKPEGKSEAPPPAEPAPPPVEKKEPPPPPPVEKKEPPPPPEPKGAWPKPSQDLALKAVDLSGAERQSHGILVFAASGDRAKLALEAHRSRKEKAISELPGTKAGTGAGLYLVWGYLRQPTLEVERLKATYDETTRVVRVTLPPMPARRPGGGIGMDWGVDPSVNLAFVGFRVDLSGLPAGDYSFSVVEVSHKDEREVDAGKFTLEEKK